MPQRTNTNIVSILCDIVGAEDRTRTGMISLSTDFKSVVSTSSTTSAHTLVIKKMEAPPGFEPGHKGFAGPCLTTWLWRREKILERQTRFELATSTLARWHSTTELLPHSWCLRVESNHRHRDFQSLALPTELPRQNLATQKGLEPSTSSVTGWRSGKGTTGPAGGSFRA